MVRWRPNRREAVAALLSAVAFPRLASAQSVLPDLTTGQFVSAEKRQAFLMGRDIAPSDIWHFRTLEKLPVLRAKQGQEFKAKVFNQLEGELWLHFFGVRGPAEMMTVAVPQDGGNGLEISFTPPDAGTFWFGPLVDASRQRDMGLAGMLIVDEASPPAALVDVPLIFDDWILDEKGHMDLNFGSLDAAIGRGRLGNWFTVNGEYKPQIEIDRGKPTRLRLLNVCNTRTISLQLKNVDVIIIAEDGQPVTPRAPGLEPMTLAPGQRMDLLIVNILDQAVISLDLREDVVEVVFLMGTGTAGVALPDDFKLPANPLPELPEQEPRPVQLVLAGGEKGGLQSAKVGEQTLELRQMLEKGLAWAINGISGLGGTFLFEAKKGEPIALGLENKTAFEQPMHIHGHVWKLVEADGKPVDDQPWRDTIVVRAGGAVKLLMVADNPGLWAIQSLIAERSDAGLIGGFRVT